MSVKLDWQIESERAYQRAGEDPEAKRRRRHQRLMILLFTLGIVGIIGGIAGAIALRLYTVDSKLKQDLVNTVHAETAALRIGDLPNFLSIMRSASAPWMTEQSKRFKQYQDLKQQTTIKLADDIPDVAVDGPRGRALVAEQIDGKNYNVVWFYWHYTDGWRHVPSDLTFWGDPQKTEGKFVTVSYSDLDAPLAALIASRVERWWPESCAYVGCGEPPHLTIEIMPDPTIKPHWDDKQPFTLQIASPLSFDDRALADPPLSSELEEAMASRLSESLFDQASHQLPTNDKTDASWLRQSIIDWLTAIMLGRGDTAQLAFIQTIKDHYGDKALIAIIGQLSTNSDISILAQALGQPLETLDVDWRPFFQWRLALEKTLIGSRAQQEFSALWDTSTKEAVAREQQRWNKPSQAIPQVQAVAIAQDAANVVTATVQAQLDRQTQVVTFRLINGTWKRFA